LWGWVYTKKKKKKTKNGKSRGGEERCERRRDNLVGLGNKSTGIKAVPAKKEGGGGGTGKKSEDNNFCQVGRWIVTKGNEALGEEGNHGWQKKEGRGRAQKKGGGKKRSSAAAPKEGKASGNEDPLFVQQKRVTHKNEEDGTREGGKLRGVGDDDKRGKKEVSCAQQNKTFSLA